MNKGAEPKIIVMDVVDNFRLKTVCPILKMNHLLKMNKEPVVAEIARHMGLLGVVAGLLL